MEWTGKESRGIGQSESATPGARIVGDGQKRAQALPEFTRVQCAANADGGSA